MRRAIFTPAVDRVNANGIAARRILRDARNCLSFDRDRRDSGATNLARAANRLGVRVNFAEWRRAAVAASRNGIAPAALVPMQLAIR